MRILIFGDSITYGGWDSRGGWVDRIKQDFHQLYITTKDHVNNCHQTINLGIGGDTSTGVLKRMESEIEARSSKSWPFAFVIAIGTNDSRFVDQEGNWQTKPDEFEGNLNKIIEVARRYTDKILIVGLFPIRQEELTFKNFLYSQARIQQYDAIVKKVASEQKLSQVELFEVAGKKPDLENLFYDDGLHPNDKGHELIVELVKLELEKLLKS